MSVPFHKQTDPNKQAGQIVNPTPENLTLAGYIKTVKRAQAFDDVANEKKLAFHEWFPQYCKEMGIVENYPHLSMSDMLYCWNAALQQGKL